MRCVLHLFNLLICYLFEKCNTRTFLSDYRGERLMNLQKKRGETDGRRTIDCAVSKS